MTPAERHIERGGKVVLRWSGGKDSTAALYYCRKWWGHDRFFVVYVNTGDAFPEVLELAGRMRDQISNFVEVKSDQPAWIAANGYPADIVTARASPFGKMLEESDRPKIQMHWGCCAALIWQPMSEATKRIGATLVITGQKKADTIKPPIYSGYVDEDGVEYWLPLETWTVPQVFAYLKEIGAPMLPHYGPGSHTGLDCWSCSAYVHENAGRYEWMRRKHPEKWAVLKRRLAAIYGEARSETRLLEEAISEGD